MKDDKEEKRKVYGRQERLQEIRRAVNRPERLDDVTVDMVYSILFYA